jgi:hypothetical protein
MTMALAFLACSGTAAAADNQDVVVVSIKGDVQITMRGATRAVKAGATVELPASVRTGADGAIELRQGPTTLSVAASTRIEIPVSGLGEPIERVLQPEGSAFYNVGKRLGKKLRVETPYLVAVIKGTQFNVAVQGDGTTISLFEGQLEIRAPDDSEVISINAGEIAIRHANDKAIRVLRMDPNTAPAKPGDTSERRGNSLAGETSKPAGESTTSTSSSGAAEDSNTSRPAAPSVTGLRDLASGTGDLDAGINLSTRGEGSVDVAAAAEAGPATLEATGDVSLGSGALDANTTLDVAIGGVTANVDDSVAVNLGGGSVAASGSATVDLGGAVTADMAVDSGIDLGAGSVSTGTSLGADAGAVSAEVSADTAIDTGSPAASVDIAASAAPVDVSAGTSVDVAAGAASVDVAIGSLDVGLDVDLGSGSIDVGAGTTTTDTGTDTSTTTDTGGLLGGLRGLLGKQK